MFLRLVIIFVYIIVALPIALLFSNILNPLGPIIGITLVFIGINYFLSKKYKYAKKERLETLAFIAFAIWLIYYIFLRFLNSPVLEDFSNINLIFALILFIWSKLTTSIKK